MKRRDLDLSTPAIRYAYKFLEQKLETVEKAEKLALF
jgi:hypothetical protein